MEAVWCGWKCLPVSVSWPGRWSLILEHIICVTQTAYRGLSPVLKPYPREKAEQPVSMGTSQTPRALSPRCLHPQAHKANTFLGNCVLQSTEWAKAQSADAKNCEDLSMELNIRSRIINTSFHSSRCWLKDYRKNKWNFGLNRPSYKVLFWLRSILWELCPKKSCH